jgi:hypothetical protein
MTYTATNATLTSSDMSLSMTMETELYVLMNALQEQHLLSKDKTVLTVLLITVFNARVPTSVLNAPLVTLFLVMVLAQTLAQLVSGSTLT